MTDEARQIAELRSRLAELDRERESLATRLAALTRGASSPGHSSTQDASGKPLESRAPIDHASAIPQKVALFRQLFTGRTDVYAARWENANAGRSGYSSACRNEWARGVCGKPQVKCSECPNQAFLALTDAVVEDHLRGETRSGSRVIPFVLGVYPLRTDETCQFLAVDFDGEGWSADALAFMRTCLSRNVPAALERSRSGEGGHVWIFFSDPVPALDARALGALLLTETMDARPELRFSSYDRLFPSQDTLPRGGFGNLIALPPQRRARDYGNSMFVDADLRPYEDQWAFLASIERMSPQAVNTLVREAQVKGRVLGVGIASADEDDRDPWSRPASRRDTLPAIVGPLPSRVKIVLADEVYIERSALPPALVTRLMRLAAFQNPEFYRAQAMRLPTYGKPRVISCAMLEPRHVALPRGCLDDALGLLRSCAVEPELEDRRESGSPLRVTFQGALRVEQQHAVDALAAHETGVLAATTAFGKTVVAAAMIARRGCNTLILVHRRELIEQWSERLRTFLDIQSTDLGVIGGGRRKPSGRVDVAIIQSLVRKGEVSDLVEGYGHLVVDECHHLSAASFERVARRSKARYVLGLSATVTRKDGHHPIIFMQCGPVRYRVDARSQSAMRAFEHRVRVRETDFSLPEELAQERLPIATLYGALAEDEARNSLIFDDVLTALDEGRSPLVLTERREHLELLRQKFERFARNIVVLRGGMGKLERRQALDVMKSSGGDERLVLATGKYLGEGFDDPRLDTLFLVLPISWKGTLAQYVGRLHRDHDGKREVRVYDYVDARVPMLTRMAAKRRAGYRALVYTIV